LSEEILEFLTCELTDEQNEINLAAPFCKVSFAKIPQIKANQCKIRVWAPIVLYTYLYMYEYLFTPWSGALLEKLTGSQLVKKSPTFYETRMFITAFTTSCHRSLS